MTKTSHGPNYAGPDHSLVPPPLSRSISSSHSTNCSHVKQYFCLCVPVLGTRHLEKQ